MPSIRTVPCESLANLVVAPGETAVCFVPPEVAVQGLAATVRVAEGAAFFFRSLSLGASKLEIRVELVGEGASCDLRSAVVGAADESSSVRLEASCHADRSKASVRIAAFAPDASAIDSRAVASVEAGTVGAEVESLQTNVFLGAGGSVRGMPELRVAASDVKARHACAVERVSADALFYLRSRGLSAHDATVSLLSARISEIFSGLPAEFVHDGEALCARAMVSAIGK